MALATPTPMTPRLVIDMSLFMDAMDVVPEHIVNKEMPLVDQMVRTYYARRTDNRTPEESMDAVLAVVLRRFLWICINHPYTLLDDALWIIMNDDGTWSNESRLSP